jgi:hypothetical protein
LSTRSHGRSRTHPTPGAAIVVAVLAVTAVGTFVAIDASRTRENPTDVFRPARHRPTTLDEQSVAWRRAGVRDQGRGLTSREAGAEDDVRSLYLYRTPSAWYGQYTDVDDAPPHRRPCGDLRRADRPPACAPPDAVPRRRRVEPPRKRPTMWRRAFDAAGVSDDRWQVSMDASPDVSRARRKLRGCRLHAAVRADPHHADARPRSRSTPSAGARHRSDGTVLTATGRITSVAAAPTRRHLSLRPCAVTIVDGALEWRSIRTPSPVPTRSSSRCKGGAERRRHAPTPGLYPRHRADLPTSRAWFRGRGRAAAAAVSR